MKHSLGNTMECFIWRVAPIVFAFVGVAGLLILFLWDPAVTSLYPKCPWRSVTGYHCPGCGSLRATHRLLHGQLADAFRLNPLLILSLPPLAYAVISTKWPRLRTRWIDRLTSRPAWPWTLLIIVLLYWLLRNVPFAPFTSLAP
jgi:hypothetical protein